MTPISTLCTCLFEQGPIKRSHPRESSLSSLLSRRFRMKTQRCPRHQRMDVEGSPDETRAAVSTPRPMLLAAYDFFVAIGRVVISVMQQVHKQRLAPKGCCRYVVAKWPAGANTVRGQPRKTV